MKENKNGQAVQRNPADQQTKTGNGTNTDRKKEKR